MAWNFKFSQLFLKQWKEYNLKSKKLIQSKLKLIKDNPFRYPNQIGYKFVFKVKISIESRYSILIYAVFMPDSEDITILGIFDRSVNYKDFEKIFNKLKKK